MNEEQPTQEQTPLVELPQISVKDYLESERVRRLKEAGGKIAKAILATVAIQVTAHVISKKIEDVIDRRYGGEQDDPEEEVCVIDQIPAETE